MDNTEGRDKECFRLVCQTLVLSALPNGICFSVMISYLCNLRLSNLDYSQLLFNGSRRVNHLV